MYFSPHTVETSWYQNHYTPRNHIWSCTNNKIQTRNNPSKVPNCSISKIATVGKLNFLLKENSCGHTSIDQVVQLYQVVVHVCMLSAILIGCMCWCQFVKAVCPMSQRSSCKIFVYTCSCVELYIRQMLIRVQPHYIYHHDIVIHYHRSVAVIWPITVLRFVQRHL